MAITKIEYGKEIIKVNGKDYVLFSEYKRLADSYYNQLENANKEIERLNNILDRLGLLDKDIDKETKIVNMTVTLPKWLKDIGKKNKINFSKLLQESLYEVLQIGVDKE